MIWSSCLAWVAIIVLPSWLENNTSSAFSRLIVLASEDLIQLQNKKTEVNTSAFKLINSFGIVEF
ncbi:hypothetical protein [Synechococcus sp. PCC 6312]|uniref:hypothetical protein n=1 Tax=Synechococcus sp. (strain ATCC 27167 / PCC 6312) TaxID=195253 RepID=UPI00029F4DA3|nr:hypothetical protein [Synechococcus sp. PCC 6312]AFY60699.1 hypothetical protein Syn6312_1537 [Synechococcus sp. PCC 6312]